MKLKLGIRLVPSVIAVLAILATVLPVSPAMAVTGIINIDPTSGPAGTRVTVTGSGFAPATRYTVTFDSTVVFVGPILPTGTLGAFFLVPMSTRGVHTVAVIPDTGASSSASFTVTPAIRLEPTSGNPGDFVQVYGAGFNANSGIAFHFGEFHFPAPVTNASGSFSFGFTVPQMPDGAYTVTASDSAGPAPSVTFRVPRDGWPIILTEDFTLTSDMTFGGTGFIIAADNVTLDLNGHTITGSYAPMPLVGSYSAGVELDGHTGATIKNGTVKGFNWGIALGSSDSNFVEDVVATDNTNRGIILTSSDSNLIKGVVASGNTDDGIWLTNSSYNVIKEVVARDNGWNGLQISGGVSTHDNQITDSTFANNGRYQAGSGILISSSDGNIVEGCTSTGNSLAGVVIAGSPAPPGLPPPPSINNAVRDSLIKGNQVVGIRLANVDHSSIVGNTVDRNGGNGIAVNPGSDYNDIRDNRIENNGANGIMAGPAPRAVSPPPVPPPPPVNNRVTGNHLTHNAIFDIDDNTTGDGDAGTANFYEGNKGKSSDPIGLVH